MAHAQKPEFFFPRNGRVHSNRWGRQFSRLLAAEVCASALVMLDIPRSEVAWEYLATHSIRQFPLHFPSRASPCATRFRTSSNNEYNHTRTPSLHLNGVLQGDLYLFHTYQPYLLKFVSLTSEVTNVCWRSYNVFQYHVRRVRGRFCAEIFVRHFCIICGSLRILMVLKRLHITIMDILRSKYLKTVNSHSAIHDVHKMKTTM